MKRFLCVLFGAMLFVSVAALGAYAVEGFATYSIPKDKVNAAGKYWTREKMKNATIKIRNKKNRTLETIYIYDTYSNDETIKKAFEQLKEGQHLYIRVGNTYSNEIQKSDYLEDYLDTILYYIESYFNK